MIENRVEPAVHIAIVPAQMPARERALESVLHEIIGALGIAPQQLPGKAPQPGDMRFDLSRRVIWHCLSPASPAAGQRPQCPPLRPQSPVGCPTSGHYFRHYWRARACIGHHNSVSEDTTFGLFRSARPMAAHAAVDEQEDY